MSLELRGEFRESTGRRLSARFVFVAVIVLVALLGIMVYLFAHRVADVAGDLSLTGVTVADDFDAFLGGLQTDLEATSVALTGGASRTVVFRSVLDRQPSIFALALIAPDGKVVAGRSRTGRLEQEITQQPWLSAVRNGNSYIGEISYEKYGVPMLSVAVPVVDSYGNFSATLQANVDLTSLWASVAHTVLGGDRSAYLVDHYGHVLIHPDLELVRKQTRFDTVAQTSAEALSKESFSIYPTFDGTPVIAVAHALEGVSWYVVVEQPLSVAVHAMSGTLTLAVVILLSIGGIMINSVLFVRRRVSQPLEALQQGVLALSAGESSRRITISTPDEFGALAQAFNDLADRLQRMLATLEQRVNERTRGLMAAAEVSRATTSLLDPSELLRVSVELVRKHFDLYYVGIFLVDDAGEYAVLRAGTGEAGRQMLANGHKLKVGGHSMIGQCVSRQEARIALDVGEEAVRFENPYLPDTHSELALPLRARGHVLGAMTVQSTKVAAFDETSITTMQTVADQLAVAIDNARLYAEAQAAIQEMQAVQQRYFGDAWARFSRQRDVKGYAWEPGGVTPLYEDIPPEIESTLTRYAAARKEGDTEEVIAEDALILPIVEHGQPIGLLGVRDVERVRKWDQAQLKLVRAIVEQFSLAVENLRLMNETQRNAAREQKAGEVVASIRSEVEIDDILRRALAELGETLNAEWGGVHLGSLATSPDLGEQDAEST